MKNETMAGNLLPIHENNGVPTVDSRIIADELGNHHKNLIELIKRHLPVIEMDYGRVAFETQPFETNGGIQKKRVACLTEGQALFIATLSRNSAKAVEVKSKIVKSFLHFREKTGALAMQVNQLTTLATTLAETLNTFIIETNNRLNRLESYVEPTAKKEVLPVAGNIIDARHIDFDFVKVNGQSVRRVIVDEKIYYSVNDINAAIGSSTGSVQTAKKLNHRKKLAVKIWIFGNTHPAWFTTKRGLDLMIRGSRKVSGKNIVYDLM